MRLRNRRRIDMSKREDIKKVIVTKDSVNDESQPIIVLKDKEESA